MTVLKNNYSSDTFTYCNHKLVAVAVVAVGWGLKDLYERVWLQFIILRAVTSWVEKEQIVFFRFKPFKRNKWAAHLLWHGPERCYFLMYAIRTVERERIGEREREGREREGDADCLWTQPLGRTNNWKGGGERERLT